MSNASTIKELNDIIAEADAGIILLQKVKQRSSRLMSKLSGREGNGSSPALKKGLNAELKARARAKRDMYLKKKLNHE